MNKKQLSNVIKHLCNNVLKIEINEYTRNKIMLKFKQLDLQSMEKTYQFLEYMDENQNHLNVSYKNPWQRFTTLSEMFNKEQNKDRLIKSKSEAEKLNQKVSNISFLIRNYRAEGKYLKYEHLQNKDSHESYFSGFEQKQLMNIGSLQHIINLEMVDLLTDKLTENFAKIILNSNNLQIENKVPKNMQNILDKCKLITYN